jgi:hypothetical protein
MFQALDNSSLEEFMGILQNLEGWTDEKQPYNSIYVSIGGKQNDLYHIFNYPAHLKDKKFRSNAPFQMIPAFIANRRPDSRGDQPQDRILVVVIDTFRNPEDWTANCRVLRNQSQSRDGTFSSLFDVLLWNQEINTRTLTPIVQGFIHMISKYNIAPAQFMMCNYIRFSHPNEQEIAIEEYVPTQIQSIINETPYSKRFYQWYGPSLYTYNMVYCYKDFNTWKSMYYTQLHTLFERFSRDFPVRQMTIQTMKEECEDNTRIINMLNQFMRFSVDITESYRKRGELASNLLI